ncbi:DUF6220 domain-containing protein [Cohnella yongneupensis]|uniref:DUF6220 domain-containing protein n=1 Tax=Cohnella yongneupensis TaxID=425006 RepID=A0ABW0R239_9BACL
MGNRYARFLFGLFAALFAVCVVVQFYLAGMALFADEGGWSPHANFAKMFEYLPLLMFILSFIGKIGGRLRWLSLGMFVLFIFQHLTVRVFNDTWVVASLHPVSGLLIAWASIHVAWKVREWLVLSGK